MSHETPHIRIRLFSFSNHEDETNRIIKNFCALLAQKEVLDKRWGFARKKIDGTEHSYCFGGGRMSLPKRQMTFDNEPPPNEMFNEITENKIEKEVQNWCNSADIFLLCMDLNNKPETEKIARLTWRIKQTDREKTILYAVINCNQQGNFSTFDEYAKFSVALNREILINGYFPDTNNQEFVIHKNEHFSICKQLFCFGEDFGYIDCLLYCINQLYKDQVEIRITNNKAYHYLTTNINFKSYNSMATKIKLAVVGAPRNGKSHFIWDVINVFEKYYGVKFQPTSDKSYATIDMLKEKINGYNRGIPKNDTKRQTKCNNHYKGGIKDVELELVDVSGEAFWDSSLMTQNYRTLKDVLCNHFIKKESFFNTLAFWRPKRKGYYAQMPFLEIDKEGKKELKLNKKLFSTVSNEQQGTSSDTGKGKGLFNSEKDDNSPETKKGKNSPQKNSVEQGGILRDGEYIVKHFENYDTDMLIDFLQEVVEVVCNNPNLNQYHNALQDIKNKSSAFWNHFYAYVFCDTCTDMVLCDLLALPKVEKQIQQERICKKVQDYLQNLTIDNKGTTNIFEGLTIDSSDIVEISNSVESLFIADGEKTINAILGKIDNNNNDKLSSDQKQQYQDRIENILFPKDVLGDCIGGINQFFTDEQQPNFYVAFRGLDVMLKQKVGNNFVNTDNILKTLNLQRDIEQINFIYFLIFLSVCKKHANEKLITQDKLETLCENLYASTNKDKFVEKINYIKSDENKLTDKDKLLQYLDNILLDESEFLLNTTLRYARSLSAVLYDKLENITGILKNRFDAKTDYSPKPHIYFTAYSIDTDFNIHQNHKDNITIIGQLTTDSQRFPIGTYNLVADLLYAHDIKAADSTIIMHGTDIEEFIYYKKDNDDE